jgi:uncharacterized membrane protein
MHAFVWGALGAVFILFVLGALRRAAWHRYRWRAGPRGPFMLDRLFRRLGTRPEQEAVLRGEADDLARELAALRGDAHTLRGEVATLLGGPTLDPAAVEATIDRRLANLAKLRARVAAALARVHATLDDAQRARLVALVTAGPHPGRFRHC